MAASGTASHCLLQGIGIGENRDSELEESLHIGPAPLSKAMAIDGRPLRSLSAGSSTRFMIPQKAAHCMRSFILFPLRV